MKDKLNYCIGVMSGTSLDGVNLCYVKFDNTLNYEFEIINAITYKFPDKWKLALEKAFSYNTKSLKKIDVEYGNYLGGLINRFVNENSIKRIEFYLKQTISLPSRELIDFKEALIFAFLGLLKLNNKINILSSVTGAIKDHSSGVVFQYKTT